MKTTILRKSIRIAAQSSRALSFVDTFFRHESDSRLFYKPLFVVGPPRSGTTLLSQLVIWRFRVCYWSNLSTCFYSFPKLGSLICRSVSPPRQEDFQSDFGTTKGLSGPCEASLFWDQWFPRTNEVLQFSEGEAKRFEREIAIISNVHKMPFTSKSVYAANRIHLFERICSKYLLLIPMRDPLFIAQSILLSRRKFKKDRFSVMPRDFDLPAGLSDMEDSVYQAVGLCLNIADALESLPSERYLLIPYDRLCSNTPEWMDKIQNWYQTDESTIQVRNETPELFEHADTVRVSDDEWKRMKTCLERIGAEAQNRLDRLFDAQENPAQAG